MIKNYILKIQHLNKVFYDNFGKNEVISDLNLEIENGEFLCILGRSGCGKTTFLRCIAGFENYNGKIYVDDRAVNKPGADRFVVFQDYNQLFPWKTVEGNIQYPLKIQGEKNNKKLKEISNEVLKRVNLKDYAKYYPHQLSGGMKQRVAIAKAIALKSKIILMDEPFAALDAITRHNLQYELLNIYKEIKSTFIFITHNIQEALTLGKRIIVMSNKGKIVYDEKNELEKPVTPASNGYGEMWNILNNKLKEE